MKGSTLPQEAESGVIEVHVVRIEVVEMGSREQDSSQEVKKYIDIGEFQVEKEKVRKIKRRARRFTQMGKILYKRGFSTPLLRCIYSQKAQYVLTKIHERVCGNYFEGRALARKVVRAGYYSPYALRDANEFVKKCVECQMFTLVSHCLPEELTSIISLWPFA